MAKREKFNPDRGKRAARADAEAAELEKDLRPAVKAEEAKPSTDPGPKQDKAPVAVAMTEQRALTIEIKGDPNRLSREELTDAFREFRDVIYKLRELLEAENKMRSDADRGRVKLVKAVDLAMDIVDSKSWAPLDDDAKEEAKEERKNRLGLVNQIAEYMGVVHADNDDTMFDRFGALGWNLVKWAWMLRTVFEGIDRSFLKLKKENEGYVKEIIEFKGSLAAVNKSAEKVNATHDDVETRIKKVEIERAKLYEEVKRLRDAKNEIAKAEARANRAEKEAEKKIEAANAETAKAREEADKIRGANVDLVKVKDEEIKYVSKQLAEVFNKAQDDTEKAKRKVDRLEAKVKKQREDIKFYEDLLTKNGVAYEHVVEPEEKAEPKAEEKTAE